MAELDIVPVWNVVYKPEYNRAIDNYWAQLKAYFRPLLLSKMLRHPRAKDTPLLDALKQTIRDVSTSSIPSFCQGGLRNIRNDADKIRLERKQLSLMNAEEDKTKERMN